MNIIDIEESTGATSKSWKEKNTSGKYTHVLSSCMNAQEHWRWVFFVRRKKDTAYCNMGLSRTYCRRSSSVLNHPFWQKLYWGLEEAVEHSCSSQVLGWFWILAEASPHSSQEGLQTRMTRHGWPTFVQYRLARQIQREEMLQNHLALSQHMNQFLHQKIIA